MNDKLRERLAEYAHGTWAGWMEYMFSKCEQVEVGIFMPEQAYERWLRQKNTAYADLPEAEKKSDREEADKILAIVYPPEVQAVLEAAEEYIADRVAGMLEKGWGDYDFLCDAVRAYKKMEAKK